VRFLQSLAIAVVGSCVLAPIAPGCGGTLYVGREMEGGSPEGGNTGEAGLPCCQAGQTWGGSLGGNSGNCWQCCPGLTSYLPPGPVGGAIVCEQPGVEGGVEAGGADGSVGPTEGGAMQLCASQADCTGATVCAQPANACGAQSYCYPGQLSGPCNVIVEACACDGTSKGFQCPQLPNGFVPPGFSNWGACADAGSCGGIGAPCSDGGACPNGLQCYAVGADGFCAPTTYCDGLVGATCPAGLVCLHTVPTKCADCTSPCVTPAEVACVCPRDSATVVCSGSCVDACTAANPTGAQNAQLELGDCCAGSCTASCPSGTCFGLGGIAGNPGASVTCEACALPPLKAGTCGAQCQHDPACKAYADCLAACP
jgi:hypothetical protein